MKRMIIEIGEYLMEKKTKTIFFVIFLTLFIMGCSTKYQAKPLPFKTPESYPNKIEAAGAIIAAQAFVKPEEAKEAFGFDIRGAGMLPVQVIFDNQGDSPLEINSSQTFLEDDQGNLWPLLTSEAAYERASKYAETHKIFKEGAYHGFLGAAAGAVVGAAIGIVTGENVAKTAGKGAAVGAAAGATLGGVKGYASNDPRRIVMDDLRQKSLQNKAVERKSMTFGFLFFPGEAVSAKELRLQLVDPAKRSIHVLKLNLKF